MRNHPRKARVSERGSILIWVALFMLVMIAFVALGVDGAKLMATRTQLQNAADAGALAGASAVDHVTGLIVQSEAVPQAQAASAGNRAYIRDPQPVLDAVVTFPQADRCQVDVSRTGATAIVTHLAHVVGVRSLDATATATAEVTRPDCVAGVVPLGVGNLQDPFAYLKGQEYTLIEGIGTGNYQYLDFSGFVCDIGPCGGNSGAQDLGCQIKYGFGCCLPLGTDVPVKTGVDNGKVRAAIEYRFDQERLLGGYDHEYSAGTSDTYADYLAHGGNGMRVVVVPLVAFTTLPGNNKSGRVNGYASFFLKRGYQKKEYYGEYIEDVVIGEGTGGNGTTHSIRLVK